MMAARTYFLLCLILGRLLRSGRYATIRMAGENGDRQVRKRRLFHAPFLIRIGGPLLKLLDTGVEILPQSRWQERERRIYGRLYGASIRIDGAGALVLPQLPGETLAAWLESPTRSASARRQAVEWAVVSLVEFHRAGLTHGDAMAENVMVDLDAGVARWFDFETIHDAARPLTWRRADDVRALLATCLVRTAPGERAEVLRLVLDAYADEQVTRLLARTFDSRFRRPLTFHLAQAAWGWRCERDVARLLRARRC
jgi:hypothetical protein